RLAAATRRGRRPGHRDFRSRGRTGSPGAARRRRTACAMAPTASPLIYVLLLLMVTAVWGWTFVLVKDAVTQYPTLPFLQIRFALALLVMAVLVRRLPTARELPIGLPAAPLAMVQMASCTFIFSVGGTWSLRMPSASVWWAIVITGVFASALAFYIQTWAQQHLSPGRTALILASEPAWALAAAVVL